MSVDKAEAIIREAIAEVARLRDEMGGGGKMAQKQHIDYQIKKLQEENAEVCGFKAGGEEASYYPAERQRHVTFPGFLLDAIIGKNGAHITSLKESCCGGRSDRVRSP